MAPEEIIKEMRSTSLMLQQSVADIVPLASKMANAQKDYRIKLSSEIVRLRIDGVPVGLSETIAKGREDVANLKVAYIVAEAEHKACIKSISVNIVVADSLRSLLKASKDENTAARKNFYD